MILGRKIGMTQVWDENDNVVPVTVIQAGPCAVSQVKTQATDGYDAVQIGFGDIKAKNVNKPMAGHFAKAGVEPGRGLWEFRLAEGEGADIGVGAELKADLFQAGQKVDVTGTTIGKGFAGAIKRHHFRSQRASHGNSLSHRAPGSIGQNQSPGRVFKGKKMAGHLGAARRCIQNLEVVRVDAERNLLAIKGAVPGAKGGDVMIKPAVKARR